MSNIPTISPSLQPREAQHFSELAGEWWTPRGKFKGLHAFNPARLKFIIEQTAPLRKEGAPDFKPLSGLSILDIGCGGGILSEPLCRLGGDVTGIDPVASAIEVARAHAINQGLTIDYRVATAEYLQTQELQFDIVIASEVIEHVTALPLFLGTLKALLNPGGFVILSTLNRTAKSYALAIVAAERILGFIPRGTHDWSKFVKPQELQFMLERHGLQTQALQGIVFDLDRGTWKLSINDTSVNYILAAR